MNGQGPDDTTPAIGGPTISDPANGHRRWARLADVLRDATTLWHDRSAAEVNSAHAKVAAGGYPLDLEIIDAWRYVDGEEMAEGGVEDLLATIAPLVAPFGLDLDTELVQSGEPGLSDYVINLNGSDYTVLYADDWVLESPRRLATVRPLTWVNQLLADTTTHLRFHTLYAGGNEGVALLLDPSVAGALRDSALFDRDDVPRLAEQP